MISPTAPVMISASSRICRANGTWYPLPTGMRAFGTSAAGGNVDQIHAEVLQMPPGLPTARCPSLPPPSRSPRCARTAAVLGHESPQALGDSQQKPHPVLQAPAVVVGPVVAQGRKELVQQIAVGRVDLDHLEAGRQRRRGGRLEGGDDRVDAGLIERLAALDRPH